MQQQFAGQVEVIGVGGSSSSPEKMQDFVDDLGVGGFAHIQDLENVIWSRYDVFTQPTFVFIDDDGSIETTRQLGEAGLTERVTALISG